MLERTRGNELLSVGLKYNVILEEEMESQLFMGYKLDSFWDVLSINSTIYRFACKRVWLSNRTENEEEKKLLIKIANDYLNISNIMRGVAKLKPRKHLKSMLAIECEWGMKRHGKYIWYKGLAWEDLRMEYRFTPYVKHFEEMHNVVELYKETSQLYEQIAEIYREK